MILTKLHCIYDTFLGGNKLIKKLIYYQHSKFPMNLKLFELLFCHRIIRIIFGFYGAHIWKSAYFKDNRDNNDYWESKESLYWHFWTMTDITRDIFKEVFLLPRVSGYFKKNNPRCLEIGFGMGKNYFFVKNLINFKEYIAIEFNLYLYEYNLKRYGKEKKISIFKKSIEELVNEKIEFDALLVFGSVLMYLKKELVDLFFECLPKWNVNAVFIFGEGNWESDVVRPDNTIMYDFKSRLLKNYKDKVFIEKRGDNNIYRYFAMC